MDLNQVNTFIRVVEDGSFTGAAAKLGLPKSSVSRAVTALEKSLGVRLLQRTTRALHLTEAGRTWFQQARPALASLTESAASVSALGTEPRGRVRMSAPPDSEELLSGFVADFRRRYPLVQVDVSFSARHVDLVAEGFDLALRAGELKDSSLVVRRIHESRLGLYAAPSYLKKRGTPRTLEDLTQHDCIVMNAPSGRATWRLSGPAGEPETVEVNVAIGTDTMQFAGRMALAGLGVAMLPQHVAARVEGLKRVLPEWQRVGSFLSIVSPSRGFEPRAVTLFKEGVIEVLGHLTGPQCTEKAKRAFGAR
ncbi:MAG: LysR family transcriptional regulator [Myxococcaceae bacterium]|nr:LysR family transcriptional regulator [Myxococcaceae bacterium]